MKYANNETSIDVRGQKTQESYKININSTKLQQFVNQFITHQLFSQQNNN